ncbi:unnamed protein product, partial [marine sediment metagenome]
MPELTAGEIVRQARREPDFWGAAGRLARGEISKRGKLTQAQSNRL